jgi:hypothetical protein
LARRSSSHVLGDGPRDRLRIAGHDDLDPLARRIVSALVRRYHLSTSKRELVVVFRLHRGKAVAVRDGEGY